MSFGGTYVCTYVHYYHRNAKTEAYDDVVCQRIHNPIDNETILTKDNEEGVSTHLHAVKLRFVCSGSYQYQSYCSCMCYHYRICSSYMYMVMCII